MGTAFLLATQAAADEETAPFAASRAESMIQARGFYGITDLHMDDTGAWRAAAFKYDRRWQIDLDKNGNLTSVPTSAQGDLQPLKPKPAKAALRLFLILR